MWVWYFFSFGIFSKKSWGEPVHQKQIISSVWKLMNNPVLLVTNCKSWQMVYSVSRLFLFTLANMREICCLFWTCVSNTGGPRILWFLVPNGYHEMQGSWIPRTILSVKSKNGSKNFPKSLFLLIFMKFQFLKVKI